MEFRGGGGALRRICRGMALALGLEFCVVSNRSVFVFVVVVVWLAGVREAQGRRTSAGIRPAGARGELGAAASQREVTARPAGVRQGDWSWPFRTLPGPRQSERALAFFSCTEKNDNSNSKWFGLSPHKGCSSTKVRGEGCSVPLFGACGFHAFPRSFS